MENRDLSSVIEKFVDGAKRIFRENLESVILYGSAATGAYVPKVSDINILLLIKKSDPGQIFAFGKELKGLIRKERFTTQILTVPEFLGSGDIFPLEYHELAGTRKVLFGDDTVKGLSLTKANLRHQVEGLLRGCIATLRQILIASGGDKRILMASIVNWSGSLRTVHKGLLRLKGIDPAGLNDAALASRIGELFGVDSAPFTALSVMRTERKGDSLSVAVSLVKTLTELAGIVDRMEESAS